MEIWSDYFIYVIFLLYAEGSVFFGDYMFIIEDH